MEAATSTTKTSPRDAELALKLGAFLLRCMGGASSEVFRVIDESGLTFSQMKVLVELDAADEDARTVTALSEELGISPASASRAAEGLVRKKLATRVEDPDDRRVRRVSLTSAGQAIADELMAARLAGLERFVDTLSADERRKLEAALEVLMERDDISDTYRKHRKRVFK
jgi:DNA-binding MarR family transcriptional regulator